MGLQRNVKRYNQEKEEDEKIGRERGGREVDNTYEGRYGTTTTLDWTRVTEHICKGPSHTRHFINIVLMSGWGYE